jgi:anti-sigma B factor antagonist
MALTLSTSEQDSIRVIHVQGEVDLYTSPELRKAIIEGLRSSKHVRLDLQRVEYMDSSGVATLVEGLKTAGKSQAKFQLLEPSMPVTKVLQLSRLDTVFDIVRGVDESE